MARHDDDADVVSAALGFLSQESDVRAHSAVLMTYVDDAMAAMSKHSMVAAFAFSGLSYLRSMAVLATLADLESLMGHLGIVVSTLTGHRDVAAVAEAGVGCLSNVCNLVTASRVVAHVDVVMSAMARRGDIGVVIERGFVLLRWTAASGSHRE